MLSQAFFRTKRYTNIMLALFFAICKKQPCDSMIDSVYQSPEYGRVGFQSETYTQRYFPKGKYYHTMQEYDHECTCPFSITLKWNPEQNWTTLESTEALNNRIGVIKFTTKQKLTYNIPNDFNRNPQEQAKIPTIHRCTQWMRFQ